MSELNGKHSVTYKVVASAACLIVFGLIGAWGLRSDSNQMEMLKELRTLNGTLERHTAKIEALDLAVARLDEDRGYRYPRQNFTP